MKKILSILICVVLSISSAWADDQITITTNVSPVGMGEATVCAHDYGSSWGSPTDTRQDDGQYSTSESAWSDSKHGALADLKAVDTKNGYCFSHWEGPDSYTYTYQVNVGSWLRPEYETRTGEQSISYSPNKTTATAVAIEALTKLFAFFSNPCIFLLFYHSSISTITHY